MSKQTVVDLLEASGYSPEAIAGILGNLAVETGGTFDPKTKQIGGSAVGAFQFDYMKPHYKAWLKENKKKDSLENQVLFFDDTIFGNSQDIIGAGNAAKLQEVIKGGKPEDVATALTTLWFRPGKPHLERRIGEARNIYGELIGGKEENINKNSLFEGDFFTSLKSSLNNLFK